jgi:hypothetical protein
MPLEKTLGAINFQFDIKNLTYKIMKKIPFLFYLFATSAFMISCNKQPSAESATEHTETESAVMAPLSEEDSFVSVSFPVDCANKEIDALLKDSRIMGMAKDTAIGGTFLRKDEFFPYANPTLEDGVMLWYNLMEIDNKKMLVLAAEPMDLRQAKKNMVPRLKKLTYPNEVFRFDPAVPFTIREEKHANFHEFNSVASIVSNADVATRQKHFEDLIYKKKTKYKTQFNKNSGLFFQNNADGEHPKGLLWSLVNQPGVVGIRYYFAYKDDERRKDKIRVILVGVDNFGRNIVPGRTDFDTATEALLIQKSIPPGPTLTPACP